MVYKGRHIEFQIGKCIGIGDNGDVYEVLSKNSIDDKLVAKFLKYNSYRYLNKNMDDIKMK